jgi:hypothetical protein
VESAVTPTPSMQSSWAIAVKDSNNVIDKTLNPFFNILPNIGKSVLLTRNVVTDILVKNNKLYSVFRLMTNNKGYYISSLYLTCYVILIISM